MNNPTLNPSVSIIIPCRNEVAFIEKCLKSIFLFDPVPGGFEVLVVDGMSEDGTRDILHRWQKEQPNLRLLNNPHTIVPTALNIGLKEAKGDWIVRLDVHSEYPKNYLRLCIETSIRTGADNVGGLCITRPRNDTRSAHLVMSITTHRFGVGNADFRLDAGEGYTDTVPYGCYRREVFHHLGFFDERLVRNQDYEFNRRIVRGGGKIWRHPGIHVHYYNQGSLRDLFRQAFITGCWNPWMWYLAPYAVSLRHCIPAVFVLGILGTSIYALFSTLGLVSFFIVMGSYFLFVLKAAIDQSRQYGWWQLPVLPFLFLTYHVSYGLGILKGWLQLMLRKSPVQTIKEPWMGAGRFRAWPRGT